MHERKGKIHQLKQSVDDLLPNFPLSQTCLSQSSDLPLLLTIPQAAQTLNLSRAKIYRLIKAGELPVVRIDRAVRISLISLQHWIVERESTNKLYSS